MSADPPEWAKRFIRRDARDAGPLASARQWLGVFERFWTVRLNGIERSLRQEEARKPPSRKGGDR